MIDLKDYVGDYIKERIESERDLRARIDPEEIERSEGREEAYLNILHWLRTGRTQ